MNDLPRSASAKMSNPFSLLALLIPGLLALLIGSALALKWETTLLLLFLVGSVYPAIAVSAFITLKALREAIGPPVDLYLLAPSAVCFLWIAAFLIAFFGSSDSMPNILAFASISSGLVICGLVILGRWGKSIAAAVMLSLLFPIGLYFHFITTYSTQEHEVRLASIQARLQEVSGTLNWEKEGPALMAERKAAEAQVKVIRTKRWQALEHVPAIAGFIALVAAALVRRWLPSISLAFASSGVLCLLLSLSYLSSWP